MQIDGLVHPHQHLRNNLPNNDNNIFDNKSQSPQRGVGDGNNTSKFPIFFLSSPSKVAGEDTQSSSSSPIKSPASQPRDDSSSSSQRDASPHPRVPTSMMIDGEEKFCTSSVVDNKEASLAAAEAAAKKLSTAQQQQNENSVDSKQVLMGTEQVANSNNTSTSLPKFFTSAVENISWFLDLLNRYPLTSLCTVAIVSRLLYRLRLFGINHIHNCLPWVRFGSEVAATGGWVKLAWTNQSSIRSWFSTTSPADTTSTSIALHQQRSWYSMPNFTNWFERNFIPIFNSLFGLSSFFSSNKNSNQQSAHVNAHHIVFDDDVSPSRDDPLRAASASLAPGERRQLRSLYVKVRSTSTSSIEVVEDHERQQQEETFSARRCRRQQQARIDVAKVALIEKFKSLPEEWRKQVSEISDSHWQMYAMSLGVIPQWDLDLMNQLREAILFRPCPAGWKMHLFADELIRNRLNNDDDVATTTNQPQHQYEEDDDDEIIAEHDEEDDEDIGSRSNININTRKPIKGGIRFFDTRVEAPHPFHSDNQFTIESIRAEALRRLQQQPNRRRQLVDLIQEMATVRSVHDEQDNNNNHNHNNVLEVRSVAPSASPVAFIPSCKNDHDSNTTLVLPASLSCSPANHHNTTIVNPFTITVTGDDDNDINNNTRIHHHPNHNEDAAAFLLHNEDASGMFLHSSERVLEQLQTAAAESPQRLRSELMKRACSVKAGATPRTASVCNFALHNQPSSSPCHNQYLTFSSPTSGEQYYQNELNLTSSALPLTSNNIQGAENCDDNDADTTLNGNNTTLTRDQDLRRPVEFDLTSPTRRQIQETLEETQTAQSVDDLLQMFMTPTNTTARQQQQSSFEQDTPHSNTAVDLFSNAIRESERHQDSNNHTNSRITGTAVAERYCRKMNSNESEDAEDDGGDYIAPAATPRNNELPQNRQPPNAPAARKTGVVFSSSGKFSVSATPRNR